VGIGASIGGCGGIDTDAAVEITKTKIKSIIKISQVNKFKIN
jgi:hypothetical protein